MRLTIGARKSDLARWQAEQVGRALKDSPEISEIRYVFKSSLGDQNLDVPLAAMGNKGVFTEDFYADLQSGACDLIVHSWKDLPVEPRPDTEIAMTLPRADARDLLLVPEAVWLKTLKSGKIEVLTSSPRRVYNLAAALPELLPHNPEVSFVNVRGNLPTRLAKMHKEKRALVVAKAGLDRLLEANHDGYLDLDLPLQETRFMILPLELNPPAPAQGALAVEILQSRADLKSIMSRLNDDPTSTAVHAERELLAAYGGGCHQKIGTIRLDRPYGEVRGLRGLTEKGEILNEWCIVNRTAWSKAESEAQVFPLKTSENSWFDRVPKLTDPGLLHAKEALWIARADALPENFRPHRDQLVWTAGIKTWRKLASAGIWVHGSCEGLGDHEDPRLQWLAGPVEWTKLTHDTTAASNRATLATYELRGKSKDQSPDLTGKTHFFWMSYSSFQRAKELYPHVMGSGFHACGPGLTFECLSREPGLQHKPKIFIDINQFLRETLP